MNSTRPGKTLLRFKIKIAGVRVLDEKIKTKKKEKSSIKGSDQKQRDKKKCPKTKSVIKFDTILAV